MAKVVIIGAGQAGAEAALALRQLRHEGDITLIGAEDLAPYSRPPLSKDFLTGTLAVEKLVLRSAQAYERADVALRLGETVAALDVAAKQVVLCSGQRIGYDACILATGSSARGLSLPGADLDGVMMLRTRADADRLRAALVPGASLAVIGAGYLGLEVAASARKLGLSVSVIESAGRILGRSTSLLTAGALAARHRVEGVALHLGAGVAALEGEGRVRAVLLPDGTRIAADAVVVSIGGLPETALAEAAGIACNGGVLANPDALTSAPDIYAIGDCARWDTGDGRGALRLESVQMASQGARAAAAAIAGQPRPGVKQPYFWSQQYDLKLQIAGLVPPGVVTEDRLEGDPAGAFAVTRLSEGVVLAVEAVNTPAKYIEAQRLIGQPLAQYA